MAELGRLVPKQRHLNDDEKPATLESWKESMCFTLSVDKKFARFLKGGDLSTWRDSNTVNRGFTDDVEADVAADIRMTAVQKATNLSMVLGIVAGYAQVLNHEFITEQSTSLEDIFTKLRAHYGFRRTGGRILDLMQIQQESMESREALWQRFYGFMAGNLLVADGGVTHNGVKLEENERFTPLLLNITVTLWLHTLNPNLPELVKQRFSTDLRSKTLMSIREEISDSIPALLRELQDRDGVNISRAQGGYYQQGRPPGRGMQRSSNYSGAEGRGGYSGGQRGSQFRRQRRCTLCHQAGRADSSSHFMSQCPFLPPEEKRFMSRTRDVEVYDEDYYDYYEEDYQERPAEVLTPLMKAVNIRPDAQVTASRNANEVSAVSATRRVDIVSSPEFQLQVEGRNTMTSIDTGAESNLISLSKCQELGLQFKPTYHRASQADAHSMLDTVGEFHTTVYCKCQRSSNNHSFVFSGLVVRALSSPILLGMPFLESNDVYVRPRKNTIYIADCCSVLYRSAKSPGNPNAKRVTVIRAPEKMCILPGESVSVPVPVRQPTREVAVEPRFDSPSDSSEWLTCNICSVESGEIELKNSSKSPVLIGRNEQICQIRPTTDIMESVNPDPSYIESDHRSSSAIKSCDSSVYHSSTVQVDPSGMLSKSLREKFMKVNQENDAVFSPKIGRYNGASGEFKHHVNMGPSLPPQHRSKIPMYNTKNQQLLQEKFDELRQEGVFAKPEDLGISVEYVSPSFLLAKRSGGHRLVTAFTEIGQYIKPQPSVMPNTNDVLRQIGKFKYVVKTDLRSAYYLIEMSKGSLKYLGVVTPFRGVYVYTRCVMGLAGSEGALEELLSKVFGDFIMEGSVLKLADDFYVGADTVEELLSVWSRVLEKMNANGLKLSPTKTVICPKSTEVLGWTWKQGTLQATKHRLNALAECPPPEKVKGLRSFIGSYKFISRVLPYYSAMMGPLDQICAGAESSDRINWTDERITAFQAAKDHLKDAQIITLPRQDDKLQIISDASRTGLASALYVIRDKPLLAGVFNVQVKGAQKTWLPCDLEALSIGCGVKHFGPYLIQSSQTAEVLTDSKPCVEAYRKLQKGHFSVSPRVNSYLSILSHYGVTLSHIAGKKNILSDFMSRNTLVCDGGCQICSFVEKADSIVVKEVKVSDVISGSCAVPFTSRHAWYQSQQDCPVLKEVSKYLVDGRTPSRKRKGIKEVRRYLNTVKLSTSPNDGLLIVPQEVTLGKKRQRIVVPRDILDGLLTALHLQLQHPSKYQMKQVFMRGYFALDADKAIDRTVDTCHVCASLKKVPTRFREQSTSVPEDEGVGRRYSADVIKRERQKIMVIREYVTSYSDACFIPSESAASLRDGVIKLMSRLRSTSGPPVVLRLDPATGFQSYEISRSLATMNITLEIGAAKNINHNPVAERCISEVHAEIARLAPTGGQIDEVTLAIVMSNLNSRIRSGGLSASEMWHQRDMNTGEQLPVSDMELIRKKHEIRRKGHLPSAKYKARGSVSETNSMPAPGDIVYIYEDRDKTRSRDRYIITRVEGRKSFVRKFSGNQLRAKEYEVDKSQIISVKPYQFPTVYHDESYEEEFLRKDEEMSVTAEPIEEPEDVESDPGNDDDSDPDVEDNHDVPVDVEMYRQEEAQDLQQPIGHPQQDEAPVPQQVVLQQPDEQHQEVPVTQRRSGRTIRAPERMGVYLTGRHLEDAVPEAE